MGEIVRAAVMVRPGKIKIQEFPFPELEDGALLLKVEMCGICGTDVTTQATPPRGPGMKGL